MESDLWGLKHIYLGNENILYCVCVCVGGGTWTFESQQMVSDSQNDILKIFTHYFLDFVNIYGNIQGIYRNI